MADKQIDLFEDLCKPEQTEERKLIRPWMKHHKFVRVDSIEELRKIVDCAIAAGVCALDTETQGLDTRIEVRDGKLETRHKIVGYCLSYDGITGYYVPVRHNVQLNNRNFNLDLEAAEAEIARLCLAAQPKLDPSDTDPFSKNILEPPKVKLLFWNAQFDQEMLYPIVGIDVWHQDSFECGLLACYVWYSDDALGLKEQAGANLKDPDGNPYEMIHISELFVKGAARNFGNLSPDMPGVIQYTASDAICTFLLCQNKGFIERIKKRGSAIYRLEKQVAQIIRTIERYRVKIDIEEARHIEEEAKAELADYASKIQKLAESKGFKDFNSGSHQQKSALLFSERGLNLEPKPPETHEGSGQYKVDRATLEKYLEGDNDEDNVIAWMVKYEQISKALSSYLTKLSSNTDELHQIRVQFKQTGAATGRFSAPAGEPENGFSGIPIQGIPARYDPKRPKVSHSMRRMFLAREGYTLVKIDFAGQELRIAANVTQEPVWIDEFLHGEGDLHTITARAFFNKKDVSKDERRAGKCVHPDTIVFSNGTYKPISVLGDFGTTPDTFREHSGSVFSGLYDRPITHLYNGGDKELCHVVTTGSIFTCTPQHQLKLADGSWRPAGELTQEDRLKPCVMPPLCECDSPAMAQCLLKNNLLIQQFLDKPKVPTWVWTAGKSLIEHYLCNLFNTFSGTRTGLATKNLVFAGQIATLMRACGLPFTVVLTYHKLHHYHLVRIRPTTYTSGLFENKLGRHRLIRSPIEHPDYYQILGVIPAGVMPCLDLTVEDHQYFANGLVTHNTANFALLYGGGPKSIVRATGCSDEEARRKKRAFDEVVPTFTKWIANQHKLVKENGGVVTPFGRWIEIPDANIKANEIPRGGIRPCDEKGANSLRAECQRKSVNYVIQGAGADIMKISLFLLYKELHKRKWLRNGFDSVRMILTVHDEIVFEIKHEMLQEAIPVIVGIMESVSNLPTNPKWVVPLIVDPSIGLNWEAKYDWNAIVKGRKVKPSEVPSEKEYILGDRIYANVPPWLVDTLKIEPEANEITPPKSSQVPTTPPPPVEPRLTIPPPPPSSRSSNAVETLTFAFGNLTPNTARLMAEVCIVCHDEAGMPLCLVGLDGQILVDTSCGIKVIPQEFQRRLLERNLRIDRV